MTMKFALVPALLAGTAIPVAACAEDAQDDQTIVVTASGYEQLIADAPASISVVTRKDLEDRPVASLEDAVRDLEGVSIVGGDANSNDIVIRGMPGEYTLIMLDGRRQSTRETMNRGTGGVQSHLVPPVAAIERIEVVRGPMSSLYGSDAMGGVVNIITRKVPERFAVSASAGGVVQEDKNFGDSFLANFWVGAPIATDTIGLQIYGGVANRAEDDIFYAAPFTQGRNRVRDGNVNGKLSFIVAPDQSLTFLGGYTYFSMQDTPGKSTAPASALTAEQHRRTYYAGTYEGRWGFGTTRLAVHQENEELTNLSNGAEQAAKPDLANTTVDALVTVPSGRNTLNLGAQYIYTKVTDIGAQDSVPPYVAVDEAKRESWAIFAEDRFDVTGDFTLTGGARLDHYDKFGSHFTPRLYANYTVSPGWTLRGGVAGGFKAPTLRQSTEGYCMSTGGGSLVRGPLCGNPDLEPETSTTMEAGVRYDGAGRLGFGATLFRTNFKNKVVSFDSGEDDPRNPARPLYVYDNVDRVVIQGVELTGSVPVTPSLLFAANYTYTDSERRGGGEPAFDGSSLDGQPLDKTPEHMANAKLSWEASDRLSAFVRAYYTGKQYYTGFRNGAVNTRTREGSTTFDIGASLQVTEHIALRAAVLNVTDKIVPVDDRGRFDGLDGNWMVDEGRRYWMTAAIDF